MASSVIKRQRLYFKHTIQDLSFTADSNNDLGSVSSLTNGLITTVGEMNGLSKISAGGANSDDSKGVLFTSVGTNHIYYKASTTQSGGYITFVITV